MLSNDKARLPIIQIHTHAQRRHAQPRCVRGHMHTHTYIMHISCLCWFCVQVLTDKPREALQSWLPQITETERKQAELLDSDSDAAYDDEMHHDNQLDDEVS